MQTLLIAITTEQLRKLSSNNYKIPDTKSLIAIWGFFMLKTSSYPKRRNLKN